MTPEERIAAIPVACDEHVGGRGEVCFECAVAAVTAAGVAKLDEWTEELRRERDRVQAEEREACADYIEKTNPCGRGDCADMASIIRTGGHR